MRTDHFAYGQATRVAGFGFFLQLFIGLTLLIFGLIAQDTVFTISSMYVLIGLLVWLSLIIVFHQHKLERLEELEAGEIASEAESGSVFENEVVTVQAAARRLRLMHAWLMPAVSILVAALLVGFAFRTLNYFQNLERTDVDITPFRVGGHLGWQLAICIGFALIAFIFSRFVAGMAKQAAWQNLRGGAGYMVGNALVLLAVAVGIVFHVFEKPQVLTAISWGICIYTIIVAAEIVLNFILNLYRPRKHGEIPRPAYDSRVLGMLAAPDSIVRSINEAVNYQFGFDITSSWGYQLLIRSFAWLLAFAVVFMFLLTMVVVVDPSEQAIRLRGGQLVDDRVYQGEVMFKWPWPVETVEVYPIGRIRELPIDPERPASKAILSDDVNNWVEGPDAYEPTRQTFLVAAPRITGTIEQQMQDLDLLDAAMRVPGSSDSTPDRDAVNEFAIVESDIILQYRVKPGELINYLEFCNDSMNRRGDLDMRERALRALAQREISQYLSTESLNSILSPQGESLASRLKARIQEVYDSNRTGVQLVSVAIPIMRPPGTAAPMFEEVSIRKQTSQQVEDEADRVANMTMAAILGDASMADTVVSQINEYNELERSLGPDAPETVKKRVAIERMLLESRGQAASLISMARARRWELHMNARKNAAEVLGQASSYAQDPELYRQRRIMEVLGRKLGALRVKYILGVHPSQTSLDIQMQESSSGLNLSDYLIDKDDETEGNSQ